MTRGTTFLMGFCLAVVMPSLAGKADEIGSATGTGVFGQFVGSSPCDRAIRQQLGIAADADSNLIQWHLTLLEDPQARSPAGYRLRCTHGATVQGTPGLAGAKTTLEKQGRWTIERGTKSNQDAVVVKLTAALAFVQIGDDLLHVLASDRSLLVGNGGWSYTLNRLEAAEKPGDPDEAQAAPSVSYEISPLAAGPAVFGVFEGRTPALGIARQLKLPADPGSIKAKWRVTLYRDPETGKPTTYKVEGTLHRQALREGKWTIDSSDKSSGALVYRLEPARSGEPPILLLKGDGNVLFFLDASGHPLVGHSDFSYTLDRRRPAVDSTSR